MLKTYFLTIFLLVLALLLSIYRRKAALPPEDTDKFVNMPRLFSKPQLYIIFDNENNSRNWWDFGARNSTLPNRGYLQVAFELVKRTQGGDYDIVPLVGRKTVQLLVPDAPDATQLPPKLWRAWAIANLCAAKGGLVMDGNSTLCVGPSFAPSVQGHSAAMFGIYPDEPVANPTEAVAPGPAPFVGWAASPGLPAWTVAAERWNALVRRGAQAWSAALARRADLEVAEAQRANGLTILRAPDGSRLANGKLRQLEDYFGRVADPADPKLNLQPGTVFVSYDGDDLARRFEFNWFLRMSPEQIKESDIIWSKLAGF